MDFARDAAARLYPLFLLLRFGYGGTRNQIPSESENFFFLVVEGGSGAAASGGQLLSSTISSSSSAGGWRLGFFFGVVRNIYTNLA